MKYILKVSNIEISGWGEHRSLAIRKGHDRSLLRSRVVSYRNNWFKEPTQPDTTKNPCQSVFICGQKHHLLVIFRVNSPVLRSLGEAGWFKWNKIMRNKANLKDRKLNTTHYGTGGYGDFPPKTKNGTNPIACPAMFQCRKPNFFTTPKPHFSAELFSEIPRISKKPFYAKQTQFQKTENHCKLPQKKYLHQFTPPNPQEKQSQSKPKANPICSTYSVAKTFCKNLHPIITKEKCLSGINFNNSEFTKITRTDKDFLQISRFQLKPHPDFDEKIRSRYSSKGCKRAINRI